MFSGGKISSIHAREILDSRGNPTVACRVTLKSGASAEAKVPSGASTGSHEAVELRDGGKRYGGKGVLKAVKNVNVKIAPVLRGLEAIRQQDIDHILCELDGTPNKSKIGANAILAVSLACAQAAALQRRLPLWSSLRQTFAFQKPPALPVPTMNVLNGGAHAHWSMDIQECMIVPRAKKFSERLRMGAETYHALETLLQEQGRNTGVGDEGGFAPGFSVAEEAFDILLMAIKKAGYKAGKDVFLACDVASSEFYDTKKKVYILKKEGRTYTAAQLLLRYRLWQQRYPFISIEDPFAEDDWLAWKEAVPALKKKLLLVGDDVFVTNKQRLQKGIDEQAATAILIKPNQVGTLSETIEAITLAQHSGFSVVISHRSGETSDTTIADLAVACGAEYIKSGAPCRSERIEKYNRLLQIEMEMEK